MKILVRAPNWVGDAVMAIPTLSALRRVRPGDEITILARPAVADLFVGQPFTDRTMEFDFRGKHGGWSGRAKLVRELRDARFDAAILLQNAFEAAWIAWRARIPVRIGYARDARGPLLTDAIRVPRAGEIPRHESYYYRELLTRARWIEGQGEMEPVRLQIPDSAKRAAESALLAAGARPGSWRVAIAPGASYGAAKCWPAGRFAAVADRLISERAADVIFFGTAAEEGLAKRIFSAMKGRVISMVGRTAMRELAAMFSVCSCFVGNDSGAMHVAAAAGLPVAGIFGSTDPEGTSPLTTQFTLIREAVSCSPCFLRTCPVDHRCMTRISEAAVFDAVRRMERAPILSENEALPNA